MFHLGWLVKSDFLKRNNKHLLMMIYLLPLTRPAVCSVAVEDLQSTQQRCGAVPAAPSLQPSGTQSDKNNSSLKWLDMPQKYTMVFVRTTVPGKAFLSFKYSLEKKQGKQPEAVAHGTPTWTSPQPDLGADPNSEMPSEEPFRQLHSE